MSRAVWKGPFVEESLMKKVDKYKIDPKKIPIKTWSRKSTIIPDFVGVSFLIYNGKKFIPITVSEDMVGHKLASLPLRELFLDIRQRIKKLLNQLKVQIRNKNEQKKKIDKNKDNTIRSINNNIRSSVRKLNPILKGIVGKKVDIAIRDLQFSEKELLKILGKQ